MLLPARKKQERFVRAVEIMREEAFPKKTVNLQLKFVVTNTIVMAMTAVIFTPTRGLS